MVNPSKFPIRVKGYIIILLNNSFIISVNLYEDAQLEVGKGGV